MMDLYLHGDITESFPSTSRAFATAAAERPTGLVALLFQGGPGWEQYVARYRDPWRDLVDVHVVVPEPDLTLGAEARRAIEAASGLFIGGGDTPRYRRIYVADTIGTTIRDLVAAGVPYGGVSAGAMLAGEIAIVGEEPGAYVGGLGLLPGTVVEAHFSELGRERRLLAALGGTEMGTGVGLDEHSAVRVRNGEVTVLGDAPVHLFTAHPDGSIARSRLPVGGSASALE